MGVAISKSELTIGEKDADADVERKTESVAIQPGQDLTSLPDDTLLELVASDSEEAFQTLVERHVDRGYAVAYRILQSGADAEDVVQDAFLQVWTRRHVWQNGRAKFSTWLYRVVSNRCIDILRKPKADTVDALPEIEDSACDQSTGLERQEAAELLERAVGKLPDQQRVAIVFSYNENMSNGEIAEIMDTTVSAVESLLKRGRQKLRDLLKAQSADILNAFTNG